MQVSVNSCAVAFIVQEVTIGNRSLSEPSPQKRGAVPKRCVGNTDLASERIIIKGLVLYSHTI